MAWRRLVRMPTRQPAGSLNKLGSMLRSESRSRGTSMRRGGRGSWLARFDKMWLLTRGGSSRRASTPVRCGRGRHGVPRAVPFRSRQEHIRCAHGVRPRGRLGQRPCDAQRGQPVLELLRGRRLQLPLAGQRVVHRQQVKPVGPVGRVWQHDWLVMQHVDGRRRVGGRLEAARPKVLPGLEIEEPGALEHKVAALGGLLAHHARLALLEQVALVVQSRRLVVPTGRRLQAAADRGRGA
mmetsp:Transcript_34537/g.111493  ORF Transcript_34537/g.111493 Transcript_34537/m.111493 type:complete len:238 (+) Transcript_34537:153-866(+)